MDLQSDMSSSVLIKNSLKTTISALPFSLQRRLTAAEVFFPYYHLVSDERVPHCVNCCRYPSVQKFVNDLDFFLKHFTPITLRQLIEHLSGEGQLPQNPLMLSFDDGYRELYEIVFPILQKRGIPAVFFINTASIDNKQFIFDNKLSLLMEHLESKKRLSAERRKELSHFDFARALELENLCAREGLDTQSYLESVEPYLTSTQVTEMLGNGIEIGSHSINHPPYFSLSLEEQLQQTLESLAFLGERFSLDYSAFAFPGSDVGVSQEFFVQIASKVDVSFGTSAGMADPVPNHFQRTSFEYSQESAKQVLAERYGVELIRRLAGRNVVKRDSHAAGSNNGRLAYP